MSGDSGIGARYEELLERIAVLLVVRDELPPDRRDFLYGIQGRLERYKERTFISAKQLNYLTNIEADHLEGHPDHGRPRR